MLYTPLQAREATGIPPETLRYWKKALPFLPGGNGYKPRFEPGDLLGLAVVKVLCNDLGMNIANVATFAEEMFVLLRAEQWAFLRTRFVVVDIYAAKVEIVDMIPSSLPTSCVVRLADLITELSAKLLGGANLGSQTVLSFPSNAIRR